LTPDILKEIEPAKSLSDVEHVLDLHTIRHFRRVETTSSAVLPAEVVTRMAAAKPDDVFLVRNPPAAYFSVVTGRNNQPLTGQAAIDVARNILQTRKNAADLAEILQVAKQGVDVSYTGDYAKIMAVQPEQANPPAPADQTATAPTPATTDSTAPAQSGSAPPTSPAPQH
jgi:hypothetical protein